MQIIKTSRLSIQEVTLEDHSFILDLVNNPSWLEFIGDRNILNQEAALNYIQNSLLNSYRDYGFGLYKMVLLDQNIPIGLCGLVKRDYLEHPDIGFAILPKFKRKGYTYEAALAIMDYATKVLNLKTILAITTLENIKSQNLLEKIGLSLLKTILPKGTQERLLLYSNNNI